jgi:hypothetical protein
MKNDHVEAARKEKKKVEEQLRQLEMPVDFDRICKDGVLERIGPRQFRILDLKRLPDHVAARLEIAEIEKTTMKGSARRSVTTCTGVLLNEATLQKKLLRIKKLLGQIMEIQ